MELKCQWKVLPESGPRHHTLQCCPGHIFTEITVRFWILVAGTFPDIHFLFSFSCSFFTSAWNFHIALLCSNQLPHLSGHWSNNYTLCWHNSADALCVSISGAWFPYTFQRKSHLRQILVELEWSACFSFFFPTVAYQSVFILLALLCLIPLKRFRTH